MSRVSGNTYAIEVTPTISASPNYTSGDQLGDLQTVWPGISDAKVTYVIQSLTVLDKASQNIEIDILFFDESPTVASSDNGAANVSDAKMADKCLGKVTIKATDYVSLSANSVASVLNVGLAIKSVTAGKIYALAVARGAGNYASTTDLVFKYVLAADL